MATHTQSAILSRRHRYGATGFGIGLLMALGLLLLRATRAAAWEGSWMVEEVTSHAGTYLYLAGWVGAVLAGLGTWLGAREERLREDSLRDPLTGVMNRRYFDQRLRDEVSLSARSGRVLSVLLLDVDCLKLINDHAGHGTGDEALRAVARAVSSEVRGCDTVARIGGDELAVLAPSTPASSAASLANRIRRALAHTDPGVTVSIGIAEAAGGHHEDVLRAADVAMYEAKRSGGDRARTLAPRERGHGPALV